MLDISEISCLMKSYEIPNAVEGSPKLLDKLPNLPMASPPGCVPSGSCDVGAGSLFFWQIWEKTRGKMVVFWLVVLKIFYFSIQLGISSSQLTNSIIFHRGRLKPPSSFTTVYMSLYDLIVIWIQCCETWGFKSQKNLKYFQDGSRMMLSLEFPAVQLFNLLGGLL